MDLNTPLMAIDLATSRGMMGLPSKISPLGTVSEQLSQHYDPKESLLPADITIGVSEAPVLTVGSPIYYLDPSVTSDNNSDDGIYSWSLSVTEPRSEFIPSTPVYSHIDNMTNNETLEFNSAIVDSSNSIPIPSNWTEMGFFELGSGKDLSNSNTSPIPNSLHGELRTDGESSDDSHETTKSTCKRNHDRKDHKTTKKQKPEMTLEERRQDFLERNRLAALKCRQRKKQWTASLQTIVGQLTQENEALIRQNEALRQQNINLKAMLLTHKECNITKAKLLAMQTLNSQGMFNFANSVYWEPSCSTAIRCDQIPHVIQY